MKNRKCKTLVSVITAISVILAMFSAFAAVSAEEAVSVLAKTTYLQTDNIEVNWDAVPPTVGWLGVYNADYTDVYNYCDYIERDKGTSFPSGVSTRYKASSWPLSAGNYKLVMFEGSGYTVNSTVDFAIEASAEADTVTVDNSSVYICHEQSVTITVSGGLTANTWHRVRLYKATGGFTSANTGFGNNGVNFGELIGDASGFTTDENGAGSVVESLHQSVTNPGMYVYTIMENWDTKAVAFVEIKEAAVVSVSRISVPLGANIPLAVKVTAGENGLEPNKTYNVRLYKAYNAYSGFGSGGINWNERKCDASSIKTDENGNAVVLQSKHISAVTETGRYAYVIMDGWDTKARVFFEVTAAVTSLPEDTPQITIDKTGITLGNNESLTVSVANAAELGIGGKYYYLRLCKAGDGYTVNDSGFGEGGCTGSYTQANGITLDEKGSGTSVQTIHNEEITEPGIYAYVLMDEWTTKARVFFEVKKKPGDVNNDGKIDILDLINLKKMYDETIDYKDTGDINGDGNLDALDLVELRKILLQQ